MNIKERIGRVFTKLVACELDLLDLILKDKISNTILDGVKKQAREHIYTCEKLLVRDLLYTELDEVDVKLQIEKERHNE